MFRFFYENEVFITFLKKEWLTLPFFGQDDKMRNNWAYVPRQLISKLKSEGVFMSFQNISNKFERRFGKYAISNLTLYLIICYGAGYLIQAINSEFLNFLVLDPFLILKGQIWRIFTWIIVPPGSSNIFFTLITLLFYYSIGSQLERTWGTYRYNIYIFSGLFFTVLGSFLLCGYCALVGYIPLSDYYGYSVTGYYMLANGSSIYFGMFSTYYINMSLFLAVAATFPDMQVLYMMIIPVKMKWMGVIYVVIILLDCIQGGPATWFVVGASLMNFVVFFFTSRKRIRLSPEQRKRRMEYRRQTRQEATRTSAITKHKCAICGRTEQDGEDLEFRFCSKCEGNYEYCQYHLFTHQHVKKS